MNEYRKEEQTNRPDTPDGIEGGRSRKNESKNNNNRKHESEYREKHEKWFWTRSNDTDQSFFNPSIHGSNGTMGQNPFSIIRVAEEWKLVKLSKGISDQTAGRPEGS
jgi:hypothetical protein